MSTRRYVSPVRAAAAEQKKALVIDAAAQFLRDGSISDFSLDAVAKAAGVTRLTVYNQFGSRRGLLEALLDDIAQKGGLDRLKEAMAWPDPNKGMDDLVEVICDFWGGDPVISKLHDAIGIEAEFAQALLSRNERRRKTLAELVRRLAPAGASASMQRNTVDLIFGLTSCAMYRTLSDGRSKKSVKSLVAGAVQDAVARLSRGSGS